MHGGTSRFSVTSGHFRGVSAFFAKSAGSVKSAQVWAFMIRPLKSLSFANRTGSTSTMLAIIGAFLIADEHTDSLVSCNCLTVFQFCHRQATTGVNVSIPHSQNPEVYLALVHFSANEIGLNASRRLVITSLTACRCDFRSVLVELTNTELGTTSYSASEEIQVELRSCA
jgi:hypothetical protein